MSRPTGLSKVDDIINSHQRMVALQRGWSVEEG
jgi:hypothetical protein